MLETAPSFSIYSNNDSNEDDGTKNTVTEGSGDFSFVRKGVDLIEEEDYDEVVGESLGKLETGQPSSPSMYLATGLRTEKDDFGEIIMKENVSEEYCRELLGEYPSHPLLLFKFAQLLQGKGDLQRAEEYYFRASHADPGDGEILARYAQLVWELHHDHGRALTYFDLAAQTAPDNSNVMAAYAKFLWETEDDDDESQSALADTMQENNQEKYFHLNPTDVVGTDTDDIESYYKRMINENPSHPIFLKKYAQFLYKSKGDLHGAEGYYSRAILAKPRDGETLSQFATLLWELYHDHDRTLYYLEQALKASPRDSDILAAYARILWTIDDE
ncbi:hypothetical protein vseg_012233 [Gypsophila vaccaria]